MEIEIAVVGESTRWVLNDSHIRIGHAPNCEVRLPAGKFPDVSGEHATLDVVPGGLRLTKGKGANGETYLNDRPAATGATIRSGDRLRLGAVGPELRFRLVEQQDYASSPEYEPTRLIDGPAAVTHEATRLMHEPTRMVSSPTAAAYPPPPPAAPAGAGRYGYSETTRAPSANASSPVMRSAPPAAARGPEPRAQEFRPMTPPYVPPPSTASDEIGEALRNMEGKLKSMRGLLVANLVLVLALFAWIFMQGQELSQTHKELGQLRVQAASAVSQLTPSLDARLSVFEKRMDGVDAKIAGAQERMVKGLDAQTKLAEDRMVERMNTEIPAMMDKFVAKKMAELKH